MGDCESKGADKGGPNVRELQRAGRGPSVLALVMQDTEANEHNTGVERRSDGDL